MVMAMKTKILICVQKYTERTDPKTSPIVSKMMAALYAEGFEGKKIPKMARTWEVARQSVKASESAIKKIM